MHPVAAYSMPLAAAGSSYATVALLIALMVAMAAGILLLSHLIGPHRHGPVKDETYEAGMVPIGDARRRFNVRFYIVAMLFLLFDVEVVFLWPWAPMFHDAAVRNQPIVTPEGAFGSTFFLVEMAVFLGILLVGYVYAWRKGVFRWT
jgi:NADH-quinone oxidoreductase subunit A